LNNIINGPFRKETFTRIALKLIADIAEIHFIGIVSPEQLKKLISGFGQEE